MAEALRQPVAEIEPTLIGVFGVVLEALPGGALWWDSERMLAVADLHLEKGSAFAKRGEFIPPYDTAETLQRLSGLIARFDPRVVVALGDSFHDNDGALRLLPRDRLMLSALQVRREWIWVAGNHDPDPPAGLTGTHLDSLVRTAQLVAEYLRAD